MTPTQLKTAIGTAISEFGQSWNVTVDEAQMLNITADDIEQYDGFVYVEEFDTQTTSFAKYGMFETNRHDVYFCRIAPFDMTAEQREHVRDTEIRPVVRAVERYLELNHGVENFTADKYPRGFDANEVLIHINFESSDRICGDM